MPNLSNKQITDLQVNSNLISSVPRLNDTRIDGQSWIEKNFNTTLYSNQMDIQEALADPKQEMIDILQYRGAGKTQALGYAIGEECFNHPRTHWISVAPIRFQAMRILQRIYAAIDNGDPILRGQLDLSACNRSRIQWKNGSWVVAVSGQIKANEEGEHAAKIVIDESHLVSSYSMSAKIVPMLSNVGGRPKVVKSGVAVGRGHFWKSFNSPNSKNIVYTWRDDELGIAQEAAQGRPFMYGGRQYSMDLIKKMPIPFKTKYFPRRPDIHGSSGLEVSTLDWQTQFEMEWLGDINNILSDEDQQILSSGKHPWMLRGVPGERYFAGLDTAPGSLVGDPDTDYTVLSIWRLNRDGTIDRVASYIWRNSILQQKQDIFDIINPANGLFKCELTFADYSNFATEMVEAFKAARIPIVGCVFGGSAKEFKDSPKNWKNLLYDTFVIALQSGKLHYPGILKAKQSLVEATGDSKVQIENLLESFDQWTHIQRVRGHGLNDFIGAPDEMVEDDEDSGGTPHKSHDDACLTSDTGIRMLSGAVKTIAELASEPGGNGWVYSIDASGRLVPGRVLRAWKTGNKPVLKITLDDGKVFRCTPDHLILMENGAYREAGALESGQSLMSLYSRSRKFLDYNRAYIPQRCKKIASMEDGGVEDVYDLEIQDHHNLALAVGIFTHNCSSDVLGVFSALHGDWLKSKLSSKSLSSYAIPLPVVGIGTAAGLANAGIGVGEIGQIQGNNPFAAAQRKAANPLPPESQIKRGTPGSNQKLTDWLNFNKGPQQGRGTLGR